MSWIHLIPIVIAFFINNLFLVPRFLFKKNYGRYIFTAALLVVSFGIFAGLSHLFAQSLLNIQRMPGFLNPRGPGAPPKPLHIIFIENVTILFLIIGFGTAIKLVFKWLQEEKRSKELEKVQLKTELEMLRQQVSPPFLMNTLNNIHALVDIDPAAAKTTIIELSKLMQYLLYDSSKGFTTLKKEVEFISSYISLMKLRYSDKVRIKFTFPDALPNVRLNSMLFTSFIENAFKHGISYRNESFVEIALSVDGRNLDFSVSNSRHADMERTDGEASGMGLENIKKSLALIYKDNYALDIKEDENSYSVYLKIPLYEN